MDSLILRGHRVIIPDNRDSHGNSIRHRVVDTAHESHLGLAGTKRYLRNHIWFPSMDSMVEDKVKGCEACLVSDKTHKHDPLKPTRLREEQWGLLGADHYGPLQGNTVGHLLVIIDYLTKYPVVKRVPSTGGLDNIIAFDEVFKMLGYPKVLRSDNGAPFNGTDSHNLQRYLRWANIKHQPTESADDPEANGLAEAFMKNVGRCMTRTGLKVETSSKHCSSFWPTTEQHHIPQPACRPPPTSCAYR